MKWKTIRTFGVYGEKGVSIVLFSVIVPYYYKYESLFRECIDSVLKQTFSAFECIIVCAESEEKSFLNCNINDERVVVCKTHNMDQSSKRNKGIEYAKGDYLVFLDADDALDVDFLKKSKEIIDKYEKCEFIVYNYSRDISELGGSAEEVKYVCERSNCWNYVYSDYMTGGVKTSVVFDSVWGKVFDRSIITENNVKFKEGLKCAEDAIFVRTYSLFINDLALCEGYKS